jgi:transcriptional regulator with XRE-family HTH domain
MCEKLIQRREVLPISLEIGQRIMEVFGYQKISNIVFRLKATHNEIDAVLNGRSLPTTELLLGIQKVTGASIDWLLTGQGSKYINILKIVDGPETVPPAPWYDGEERERPGPLL